MAKRISLSRGVDPETVTQLKTLAERWKCSEGEAIDRAVGLAAVEGPNVGEIVSEMLDLVRSLPDREDMEMIVDVAMQRKIDERAQARVTGNGAGPSLDPVSIPGVRRGVRESSYERAAREKREAEDRVRSLDSVDDPSIARDAEFVSG